MLNGTQSRQRRFGGIVGESRRVAVLGARSSRLNVAVGQAAVASGGFALVVGAMTLVAPNFVGFADTGFGKRFGRLPCSIEHGQS